MARPDPVRISKWIGLAFVAAWLAMMAIQGEPATWAFALFFLPIHAGPAGIAAMLAKASPARADAWFFLVLEALLIASYVAAVVLAGIRAESDQWTVAGASIFVAAAVPFYQYCAVGLVFFCAYAAGWRARPEWLKG